MSLADQYERPEERSEEQQLHRMLTDDALLEGCATAFYAFENRLRDAAAAQEWRELDDFEREQWRRRTIEQQEEYCRMTPQERQSYDEACYRVKLDINEGVYDEDDDYDDLDDEWDEADRYPSYGDARWQNEEEED